MPGNHVVADMVAARIVSLTVNKLGIASNMSRKFEREFQSGTPFGDTLRIKKPFRSTIRDGFTYQGQSIDRRYTTLVADQKFGADLDYDTIEKAVLMERSQEDLDKNIFDPIAAQIAQEIDSRAARHIYLNTPNVVGALGTTPTSLATYTAARTRIKELGGWETAGRIVCAVTPEMMGTIVASSSSPNLLSLFQPSDTVAKAFKKGYIGEYADLSWIESMSLYRHTTGVITTQATGTTVSGGGQSGSTLNLAGTSTDTLKAGDIITIASRYGVNSMTRRSLNRLAQFKIMADATFASSAATVQIYPSITLPGSAYQNVDSNPAASDIVLLMPGTTMVDGTAKSGIFGAVFTDEAFAMVGIDLPMPTRGSQDFIGKYTDPDSGISVGIWREAQFGDRSWRTRYDVWLGFAPLLADVGSVLIASSN